MGSIPVLTANDVGWCNGSAYQTLILMMQVRILPRQQNGGCSLFGKVSRCEREEQGSNPAAHPKLAYSSMEEPCATNAEMEVRIFLSQQKIILIRRCDAQVYMHICFIEIRCKKVDDTNGNDDL